MKLTMIVPALLLVIVGSSTFRSGEARSLNEISKKSKCPHLQNEGLHAVLDRVCEECFDMFRMMDPDVGAKCKRKCFKNDHYQWCAASISNADIPYPENLLLIKNSMK